MPIRLRVVYLLIFLSAALLTAAADFLAPRTLYRVLFLIYTFCGGALLLAAIRKGTHPAWRSFGLLVGVGGLILALSLLHVPWLDTPLALYAGMVLMLLGGVRQMIRRSG